MARAIKNAWPISEKTRELVVTQMELLVENSEAARDQIAAAKVLIAADNVNAKREATDVEEGKPDGATYNTQINVNVNDPAELAKLDYDQLLRRHREALSLPAEAEDAGAAEPGAGSLPA